VETEEYLIFGLLKRNSWNFYDVGEKVMSGYSSEHCLVKCHI